MRATLDKVLSGIGLLLAVVLVVAGGLMTWANVFIGSQVEEQFSAQDIVMPTQEAIDGQVASGGITEENAKELEKFAGEKLDNGPAARAYADHYILAHMNGSGAALNDGEPVTYEEASSIGREKMAAVAENADATEEEVAEAQAWMDLRESLFQGNTLRGLLLYGFAFATMGTIAGYAAIAAYVGAALFLVLGLLGLAHSRKVAHAEARAEA
ncbi:hypothetical protein [Nocardioides campestrisoli]|uniref:hypothetical protein n=1 Tax=Nocardioides campestrisoli TaxID=2736757 RepID=UPI00174957F2|nr:hypothetical protein [Nocardioides campestrisoli]